MFGNTFLKEPKLRDDHVRPNLEQSDIFQPSAAHPTLNTLGYAHRARAAHTDYPTKLYNYKISERRRNSIDHTIGISLDFLKLRFATKTLSKRYQLSINNRFTYKLEKLERETDGRRYRLSELLANDEKAFKIEAIVQAQEGDAMKFDRMRNTVKSLQEQREKERQTYIHKKRTIQYANRCADLRPIKTKKNLLISKEVQLQQMRENEARREADRELDMFWCDIRRRQDEAMLNRETQDAIFNHNRNKEVKEAITLQIEGKKLQKLEKEVIEKANYEESMRTLERMNREDNEALLKQRQKRNNDSLELRKQIQTQKTFLEQRKKDEKALADLFSNLGKLELEREKAKISNTRELARREVSVYKQHLLDLEAQRKKADFEHNQRLAEYQEKLNQEQIEQKCALAEIKRKKSEECVNALKEQMKQKKIMAEENLRNTMEENDILQKMIETHKQLSVETAKIEKEAVLQYRQDLQMQINYNKILKERERVELERQLKVGMEEEESYKQLISDLINEELTGQSFVKKHPFRKMLEKRDCRCPELENNTLPQLINNKPTH